MHHVPGIQRVSALNFARDAMPVFVSSSRSPGGPCAGISFTKHAVREAAGGISNFPSSQLARGRVGNQAASGWKGRCGAS